MIVTDRLILAAPTQAMARAIVAADRTCIEAQSWAADFPTQDDQDAIRMLLRHPHEVFGSFLIQDRASTQVLGTIGFFSPPDEQGSVMIGYGLAPSARGQGVATEALRALVDYAKAQGSVRKIVADALQENVASHRVMEKAGFTMTHTTADAYWFALSTVD